MIIWAGYDGGVATCYRPGCCLLYTDTGLYVDSQTGAGSAVRLKLNKYYILILAPIWKMSTIFF